MNTPPSSRLIRAGLLAGTAMCSAGAAVTDAAASDSGTAQQSSPADANDMQEIVVTATRHDTKLLEIQYNISAVSGDSLTKLGITDITQLSQLMPGLDFSNQGAGRDAFENPIIRGLNLSSTNLTYYPPGAVSPVSTYIGDTPVSGRFELNDLQRVEVLRGPQGTLYGAGAIAGTIRLIPNDPKIGEFSGNFETSVSTLDHSREPSYGFDGVVNVPLNDEMAFRLSGRYQRDAGYIDDANAVLRTSNSPTAPAVLADPNDVADSRSIRYTAKGVNWDDTYGGRAAILFQPADRLRLVLSYDYSHVAGGDNPAVNTTFPGGPDVIDPRVTVPVPGRYQNLDYILQPYTRDSQLPTLEANWDLGFATLTSNSSYYDSHSQSVSDFTYLDALFAPSYARYYTGVPVFPRLISPDVLSTKEDDVTEEVRLVSDGKSTLEYVVGAFFQHHQDSYSTRGYEPGAGAWDAATPAPVLPIVVYPNSSDLYFVEDMRRTSLDRSFYGELTYHVTSTVQVTAGGRAFWQASTAASNIIGSVFDTNAQDLNTFSDRGQFGKLNASWDYVTDHRVYATFSQGYRPGGANGVPLAGAFAELPALRTYSPDHVDNYEVGAKGSFGPMLAYTIDYYDMEIKNAQLSTITPVTGYPVVVNTNGARTRGVEGEVNGRIIEHLTYTAGFSYVDAVLTHSFDVATADGGLISGNPGDHLPGSARQSWSASLSYDVPIGGYDLQNTLGVFHKGEVGNVLPSDNGYLELPSYTLANLNVTLRNKNWHLTAFVNNLTNERAVTGATSAASTVGPQGALTYIEPPREIGLRVGFDF